MATPWKLRQLMADRRLNNREVAEKMQEITGRNTHATTIARWAKQDVMPKIDGVDLEALTQVLECSYSELLKLK